MGMLLFVKETCADCRVIEQAFSGDLSDMPGDPEGLVVFRLPVSSVPTTPDEADACAAADVYDLNRVPMLVLRGGAKVHEPAEIIYRIKLLQEVLEND
jgi:hypothetical protein